MLWSFCSAKGGVGTSTIAAAVSSNEARRRDVVLVDFRGDLPNILGVSADGPGISDWLASSAEPDAISELLIAVDDRLQVLPSGPPLNFSTVTPQRAVELATYLDQRRQVVIADLGVVGAADFGPATVVAAASSRLSLVLRACYLCLHRARDLSLEFHDLIEVREGGRALTTIDIEGVLGRPVEYRLPVDPSIARVVDAGLLRSRTPRALRRLARSLANSADSIGRTADEPATVGVGS